MIFERSFIIIGEETYFKNTFIINNGLQQDTINSPILFYTSDLLKMFSLNQPNNPRAIAFADDLIVYSADSWSSKIQ